MSILQNAVNSIKMGLEDFNTGQEERLISAIRNLQAGILLLCKEKLLRLSPPNSDEVLIKERIKPHREPDGSISFKGNGKKTVTVEQIKDRFKWLGIYIDTKKLDSITEVRNDVEHYYTNLNQVAFHGVIVDAFFIIRDFVSSQLDADPQDLLGEETWQGMLSIAEIYQTERGECDNALAPINWESDILEDGIYKLKCSDCGSDLLKPEGNPTEYQSIILCCRACGLREGSESFIPTAIHISLGDQAYRTIREGEPALYTNCPDCYAEAYIMEEKRCALCGYQADHECVRCGENIPPEEMDSSPYCGWCAYMMSKDD